MFSDLHQAWYPALITEAVRLGWIRGFDDGTFRPRQPLTREEMIIILMRYYQRDLHQKTISDLTERLLPTIGSIFSQPSPVSSAPASFGSSIFVGEQGEAVSNWHVVQYGSKWELTTHDGQTHPMRVVRRSHLQDLVLLHPVTPFPSQPVLFASEARHGEFCLTIGSPLQLENTVTFGLVSHNRRRGFIQIDAPISPGNSGGGAFNLQGECIGVPTFKLVGKAVEGIGLLIPSVEVQKFLMESSG